MFLSYCHNEGTRELNHKKGTWPPLGGGHSVSMRKLALLFPVFIAIVSLAGCNSKPQSSQSAKPAPKQAEYETGRVAFQKMYLSARGWAGDATPFRLQSQYTADAPVAEGKAGLWRASFASPGRHMMKMFIWSGLVGPEAPEQGVTFTTEDSWSSANTSTHPFSFEFLKIDSDKAFELAEKNGGSKLTKANPKQPVFFVLDWDNQKNMLIWHVIYGSSQDDAKLRIAVNASTGEFERIEK
jgi:uncharacterized lipoprotein YajG